MLLDAGRFTVKSCKQKQMERRATAGVVFMYGKDEREELIDIMVKLHLP